MPKAREWAENFEQHIKAYGFSEEQIHRHKDSDWNTMKGAIWYGANSARAKIEQNASQGRRTLLLYFYAGHGATDTEYSLTLALLNSNQRGGVGGNQFRLEGFLRNCAA